ncbi:NAD(P)-binding protein, partial [Trichocladium antarcticum]
MPAEDEDGNIPVGEVPGFEFSGYVVSTSPRSPFCPGTEVYGRTSFRRPGVARTYMAAKFQEMARKPLSMTWEQSAAVPLGGVIAFRALFEYNLIHQPALRDWGKGAWARGYNQGTSLLITGGATPAGLWAVQFAKLAGVGRIVATCPPDQMDLVLQLGADEALDWALFDGLGGWNGMFFGAVLDFVGGPTLPHAWRCVGPGGKILSAVGDTAKARPRVTSRNISHSNFVLAHASQKQLDIISSLSHRGLVRAVLDPQDVFEFADYEAALERLRTNPRGQVVLKM